MFFRTRPILKKIAYPALIFTTLYLTQHTPKNSQLLVDDAFNTLKKNNLENINADILFRQIRILYEHPDEIPKSKVKLPELLSIQIKNGGNSIDEWAKIAATIVKKTPKFSLEPSAIEAEIKKVKVETFFPFDPKMKFLGLQGRTIKCVQDNVIYAIKVQKKGEAESELTKEYQTTKFLSEHKKEYGLKSQFPVAIAVMKFDGIFSWLKPKVSEKELKAFSQMIAESEQHEVYIYKVPRTSGYFTYLHDPVISDEEFKVLNQNILNDVMKLLQKGIAFVSLPMYHNTDDMRLHRPVLNDRGTGQIRRWQPKYENFRQSGIADVGDHRDVYETAHDPEAIPQEIGKCLNALMLIAGERALALSKNSEKSRTEIEKIWFAAAQQVFNNCATAASLLTDLPAVQIKNFFSKVANVKQLARQMHYWMTPEEYVTDLRQNRIKEGIYSPETKVEVTCPSQSFNDKVGFSTNGIDADLGPENGQNPVKEMDKLLHWMVSFIYAEGNLMRLKLGSERTILEIPAIKYELAKQSPLTLFGLWPQPTREFQPKPDHFINKYKK